MALRDEGTYPLRVFALINKVRDGKFGDNLLGGNDLIYQPVMSMFSWTIPIQFFSKSGRFTPRAHYC